MAKMQRKRKVQKTKKSSGGGGKPRRRVGMGGGAQLGRAQALARLMADPCAAPLVDGVHPGEQGFTSRFVSDTVVSATATFTCGVVVYHPSSGLVHTSGAATSSTATTLAYGSGASPGFTTLNSIAAKQRAVAACITMFPSAVSITSITGELVAGVCSLDTLPNGASVTFDQFFSLGSVRAPIERRPVDVKWYPNTLDDRYQTSLTLTGTDASDTNVVFIAFRGYPASQGVSVRMTGVLEWTPRINVGVATSNTVNPNPVSIQAVTARMSAQRPSWWHNLASGIMDDVSSTARYVARAGLSFGASRASQYITGASMAALTLV